MLEMKLAEYDLKTGKFLRFLKLVKTKLSVNYDHEIVIEEEGFLLGRDSIVTLQNGFDCLSEIKTVLKDKTDPLNRFNGLFNGQTYGEGRFVLTSQLLRKYWQDSVVRTESGNVILVNEGLVKQNLVDFQLGNLHESPELFEKIK